MYIVLIVLLILLIVGLPQVGWAPARFGYYPSGLLLVIVIVLIVLLLLGRL